MRKLVATVAEVAGTGGTLNAFPTLFGVLPFPLSSNSTVKG
jgi:hypothetical protein